jgi:NAD(P)-dependent dehydrogenase (short-subunit alcohol dehydrogenase family)
MEDNNGISGEGRARYRSGFGYRFATCRRFAEAGAFVLLTDVDAGKGEQAAAELRSWGGLVQFRALDVNERLLNGMNDPG